MVDTGFWVAPQNIHRFVGKWMPIDAKMNMSAPPSQKARKGLIDISSLDGGAAPGGQYSAHRNDPSKRRLSGGGGLVGTAMDYAKFCEMLMLGGMTPSKERIISSKTLEWMTKNHLVKNGKQVSMDQMSMPGYTESTASAGTGFGLGFSVSCDPVESTEIDSEGELRTSSV